MEWLELGQLITHLINAIEQYSFSAIFTSVFLLGETAIISLLTITQQTGLSVTKVIIASTLATLVADIFWIAVGRYYPKNKVPPFLQKKLISPLNTFFTRVINKNIFVTLIILKFLIGIRIAILLHLSHYKISWGRILVYDFLGTLIYMCILAVIGTQLEKLISTTFTSHTILISILSGLLIIILLSRLVSFTVSKYKGN